MSLVTYKEAAEFLGIPTSSLYALVSQKRVPFVSYGPRYKRFDTDALRKWVDQHREEPSDAHSVGGGR